MSHHQPFGALCGRRAARWVLGTLLAGGAAGLGACSEAEPASGQDLSILGGMGGVGGMGGAGGVGGGGGGGVGGAGAEGGGGAGGNPDNQRPILRRIGDKRARVGEQLEVQLEAGDPDNDPLSFNVRSALPEGAKFEKEIGLFTWRPAPPPAARPPPARTRGSAATRCSA